MCVVHGYELTAASFMPAANTDSMILPEACSAPVRYFQIKSSGKACNRRCNQVKMQKLNP